MSGRIRRDTLGGYFHRPQYQSWQKSPPSLPPAPDQDTSREYQELATALVAEMHRLCLPANIEEGYGSSPVFSDPKSQEKFWKRTGYSLNHYEDNYNKLPTALASDPHPKRNRKKFDACFIDGNDPEIVAWRERHPHIVDEDFPEATGWLWKDYPGTGFALVYEIFDATVLKNKPRVSDD